MLANMSKTIVQQDKGFVRYSQLRDRPFIQVLKASYPACKRRINIYLILLFLQLNDK